MIRSISILLLFATVAYGDDVSLISVTDPKGKIAERFRFVEDFDNDGETDLLLSHPISSFGNGGGGFDLYLREDGALRKARTILSSPNVVALEHFSKQSKIWVFHRGGGNIGQLGYYRIEEGRLSEFEGFEINPGDGGSEFSNSLLNAVVRSQDRIYPEQSTTVGKTVHWHEPTTMRGTQLR